LDLIKFTLVLALYPYNLLPIHENLLCISFLNSFVNRCYSKVFSLFHVCRILCNLMSKGERVFKLSKRGENAYLAKKGESAWSKGESERKENLGAKRRCLANEREMKRKLEG
jgi:hypothetical protein